MNIVLWIIFGAIVGWVASVIMKTDSQQGVLLNIVVGVIGSFVGGWFMNTIGERGVTGIDLYSFAVAVAGSVVLILIVKSLQRIR
jgi:uncharacterized membrane protein YeaQ/YmgE (transglycosylase-associated protein family)